jgi:DNA polymerase elongation subunit (family B)
MLETLSHANDARELSARYIAEAIEVLNSYAHRVLNGECNLSELVFTVRISRAIEDYQQFNHQVAALMQLKDAGVLLHPGETVGYIITDHKSRDYRDRVKVVELLDGKEEYDRDIYYEHLLRAGESLLLPFGYTAAKLRENVLRTHAPNQNV